MKNFEVGERVQVIKENELKTGVITDLYKVDALVKFDGGSQKEACIPFAYMRKLEEWQPIVLPKHMDELIKHFKQSNNGKLNKIILLEDVLYEYLDDKLPASGWRKAHDWLQENLFVFVDAVRYGYVVEEEKKYYVKFPGAEFNVFLVKTDDGKIIFWSNTEAGTKFTEQEIKELDERYWAFAVPVEEVEAE
ncbi:TPA: DUF1642 domain-containing protein [Listeria monocytogenes]